MNETAHVDEIVRVQSYYSAHDCIRCAYPIAGAAFDVRVNHYLKTHNARLIHVGQETVQAYDGQSPVQQTVAVLSLSG